MADFTNEELLAWLDETLPLERSSAFELHARQSPEIRERLESLRQSRDQGGLTLGEIWRRHRIGCFSRDVLARHLRGETGSGLSEQIQFHLETIECVWCRATIESMSETDLTRTTRVFQTSLGGLKP
jgi:hypothetical protein